MTFTKDEVNVGKALHTQLKQTEKVRRAIPCSFEDRQAYREKKDEVRSFWLRHGEAALDALEEARLLLGNIEWLEHGGMPGECPRCRETKAHGHNPLCELGQTLRAAEGDQGE